MELDVSQVKTLNLTALGKGIITFNFKTAWKNTTELNHCRINFQEDNGNNEEDRSFWIIINKNGCFYNSDNNPLHPISVDEKARIYPNEFFLTHAFWLSIFNEQNQLQFGYGEPHERTTLGTLNNLNNINIKTVKKVTISLMRQESQNNFVCFRLPPNSEFSLSAFSIRFQENIKQIVVSNKDYKNLSIKDDCVSIDELDSECQDLYYKIAGIGSLREIGIELNNFSNLEPTIQRSLKTPGCILNRMLYKKKLMFNQTNSNEFDTMTFLSIAFSKNTNFTGDAIILEILPAGHHSPIHSHFDCYSIINVLSGCLLNENFPFISTCRYGQVAYDNKVLTNGMITWTGPHLFQTHQVTNLLNDRASISLHAYKYGNINNINKGFTCDWARYAEGKEDFFSNDRLGFIKAMKYENYLSRLFNDLQLADVMNRGVSREIINDHTNRLIFCASYQHSVVDEESDHKVVGCRVNYYGNANWIFIYSANKTSYLIRSTEKDNFLFSKGTLNGSENLNDSPSAICLSHMNVDDDQLNDLNHNDRYYWTIIRVDRSYLIRNLYTGRYLASIGDDQIDDHGGWLKSPRIVCSSQIHANRTYWNIIPEIILNN